MLAASSPTMIFTASRTEACTQEVKEFLIMHAINKTQVTGEALSPVDLFAFYKLTVEICKQMAPLMKESLYLTVNSAQMMIEKT